MRANKFETYIGIGLLVLVVLAFIVEIVAHLPKDVDVQAQAQVIPTIPRDLFSSTNAINKQIQQLNVPSNVPVVVGSGDVGRSNVFSNF
jgi:hypothetical protein